MAKIAILGGGMAALSAAYQLTKTPALQAANQVTVYQLGWRLGGKAASGMDSLGRNLEHGLHVWFGCYENTFQMIQEVYAARGAPPPGGWALATWQDAVKPQLFTPIGVQGADGTWSYFPLTWATNGATPSDGTLFPTIGEMFETVLDWIILYLEGKEGPRAPVKPSPAPAFVPGTAAGVLA
ncbi:MAG TPA: NAD(P)-binding protein, partial [Caulobacteraceae bacterium]